MSDAEKDKAIKPASETNAGQDQKKPKAVNEKLRKKLEKLKKNDPNIYPVF